MSKKIFFIFLLGVNFLITKAQSFDVENIKNMFGKNKLFKLNGGLNVNSVFYDGSDAAGRDPFAYYLTGNINLNIYNQLNLPFSFSLTNAGRAYSLPSPPNRLSIHPTYKWMTGHIGDISMSFSPYTLNGHLFTGIGCDLSPGSVWECSVVYGRLQKATEYNDRAPALLPAYKRMGYGAKVGWKKRIAKVSFNFFMAKDDQESLYLPPDSLGIKPVENLAGSLFIQVSPLKQLDITIEYALSLWNGDIRSPGENQPGILGIWPAVDMSSACYDAVKIHLAYAFQTSRIGVGYERIDPGYKTLGAYYFTNDLENFTLNISQSLWSNKFDLSFEAGYQRDDLAKDKMSATDRFVGSTHINASFSKRLSANLSYSNFQTYTNVRPMFESVNQLNSFDSPDTLNYVQLSQSAMMNLNWIAKQSASQLHNLNMTCSYQDAADKQGGVYRPGSISEMLNVSTAYNIVFVSSGWGMCGAGACSYHMLRNQKMVTWGPTLGNNMKFFKKKVNVSNNVSYNSGRLSGVKQNEVFSYRCNIAYNPYARHNITCAYHYQWRCLSGRGINYSSLGTLGYTYSF